jgi:hypothetical protein
MENVCQVAAECTQQQRERDKEHNINSMMVIAAMCCVAGIRTSFIA